MIGGFPTDIWGLGSCADQEEHQDERDQVQDPVQSIPLHTEAQGLGQGGQVEAEFTSWYVKDGNPKLFWEPGLIWCVCAGLVVEDVSKKNKKPKKP